MATRRVRPCRPRSASGNHDGWLLSSRSWLRPPVGLQLDQSAVRFRPTIAEELPDVPHLSNLVEVQFRRDELVAIARRLRYELSARVAEVALAVELADAPRLLVSDAVDRADEERVRHRVRRLLELPQIFRQPRNRRGRIEHDFRAVQPELARAFGEMAIVADVDTHVRITRLENR